MSRTIRFHKFGPAEVLKCEEHAAAMPAPGEVQVRVEAIGISWYDVLWRQNLASYHARLPSGLGHEMAGVVTAVGEIVPTQLTICVNACIPSGLLTVTFFGSLRSNTEPP